LLCFFRSGNSVQDVPGCSGAGSPGTDYCSDFIRPTTAPSTSSPTTLTRKPTPIPSTAPLSVAPTNPAPTQQPTTPRPSPVPTQADSLKIIASGPFGNCEGSCNNDLECEFGLNCFKTSKDFDVVSLFFVPGCSGTNLNADNFCKKPSAGTVVIEGRNGEPKSAFPLGKCEGVCTSDDDCEESLECFSRVSNERVRGCAGAGSSGVSYCFDPLSLTELGDNGSPANVFPLGICEGDCDSDSECGEGLVCFRRGSFESIPGCFGSGVPGKDYCIPGTRVVPTEPEPTLPSTGTPPTPTPGVFPGFPPSTGTPPTPGVFPGFPPSTGTPPTPTPGVFPGFPPSTGTPPTPGVFPGFPPSTGTPPTPTPGVFPGFPFPNVLVLEFQPPA
jgi:hypothetical protein